MNAVLNRSYRENLMSHGMIYLGGEELEITIKDISLTGLLAHLKCGKTTRDANDQLYKRKAYRKNMATPGKILINGEYWVFDTVNVSVDGLMINIEEPVD